MRRLRRTSPLAAIALLPGLARSQPSVGCPLAPDSAVLALLAGTLLPATSPTAATQAAQAAPRPALTPLAAALDRLVRDYPLARASSSQSGGRATT